MGGTYSLLDGRWEYGSDLTLLGEYALGDTRGIVLLYAKEDGTILDIFDKEDFDNPVVSFP